MAQPEMHEGPRPAPRMGEAPVYGTPAYAAPEQPSWEDVVGSRAVADRHVTETDEYSLRRDAAHLAAVRLSGSSNADRVVTGAYIKMFEKWLRDGELPK